MTATAMIQPAGKYTPARNAKRETRNAEPRPRPAAIFVPRLGREIPMAEWYWRELREGGLLRRYVQSEKFKTRTRQRAVGRQMHGFQQNNKSDFRLLSAVPAREFFRWRAQDPHFWDDNKNLKSLKRDNPDMCIYV